MKTVIKRSGNEVNYDRRKIFYAISGANREAAEAGENYMTDAQIDLVASRVESDISARENISVEEIQDIVEKEIMNHNFFNVAKRYIVYRQQHAQRRQALQNLMETYSDIFFSDAIHSDLKRDNANINTDASMGIMLKLGAEGAKHFVDNYIKIFH